MIIVKKTKENICVFAHRIFYIHNPVNCNSKEAAYINLAGYTYLLDVLGGQPIKLIQVVSTSEFHEY